MFDQPKNESKFSANLGMHQFQVFEIGQELEGREVTVTDQLVQNLWTWFFDQKKAYFPEIIIFKNKTWPNVFGVEES